MDQIPCFVSHAYILGYFPSQQSKNCRELANKKTHRRRLIRYYIIQQLDPKDAHGTKPKDSEAHANAAPGEREGESEVADRGGGGEARSAAADWMERRRNKASCVAGS